MLGVLGDLPWVEELRQGKRAILRRPRQRQDSRVVVVVLANAGQVVDHRNLMVNKKTTLGR